MIKEDKTRIQVVITKDTKEKLEKLAKQENRSVSNFVSTLISNHIKENFPNKN